MPREATGELKHTADGFAARITIEGRTRRDFLLTTCATEPEALARCKALAAMAARLRRAGHAAQIEPTMTLGAKIRAGTPWDFVVRTVDDICGGRAREGDPRVTETPRRVIDRWTKGELAREFPDYISRKRSARRDVENARHVPDEYFDTPLRMWTAETYQAVMRRLPEMASASRRHVAQLLHRTFAIAIEPLGLLTVNPIPRMPKIRQNKLPAVLLPQHQLAIARAVGKVDLGYRYLWSFQAETGWRISQATGKTTELGPDGQSDDVPPLYWRDIKWEREVAFLQITKTTPAIEVPLDPDVLAGLKAWRTLSPCASEADHVFVTTEGTPIPYNHVAATFREHLILAGVTRKTDPDLFPEAWNSTAASDAARTRCALCS